MRIAMWSGPRNLSTAMMYAFGNRTDCAVWDEPYYAAYLKDTGLDHPMRAEIMATWPLDPVEISGRCSGATPDGKDVFYQKHMTQHMLPGYDLGWTRSTTNIFLIRHPARVIASYAIKRENPNAADIGFERQARLFDQIAEITGTPPPVFDADDIRRDPKSALEAMCAAAGIAFQASMLSWPAGPHPDDGPWAPHWYGAVHKSTGFAGPDGPLPTVSDELRPVLDAAMPHYDKLKAQT